VSFVIVLVVGLIEAGVICFLLLKFVFASQGSSKETTAAIEQIRSNMAESSQKVESLFSELRPFAELHKLVNAAKIASDVLRADKGRVTITQAELETVETRLKELEEIERELEASGIETEEEVKILTKKEQELASRNNVLKEQIKASQQQMDTLLDELKDNAVAQEQIMGMRTALVNTELKSEEVVMQIELGNDAYFELKRRYDALDIEYAQLYEKFSEAEAMLKK
jgi:chromosome segregation ATPase